MNSNTIPRSIQLKLSLIIPKILLEDELRAAHAENTRRAFEASLKTFQEDAVKNMQTIAEFALASAKELHAKYLMSVEKEIIDFYQCCLFKLDPVNAALFKTSMANYPVVPSHNTASDEVKEVLSYIRIWDSSYKAGLKNKYAKEVESEKKNEKKVQAKGAAMDIVEGDGNNLLVRDLVNQQVNQQLKPLKNTIDRLNKAQVEKSTSTLGKKKKDSAPSSNVSWDNSVPRQAEGKGGKRGNGKKREREEGKAVEQGGKEKRAKSTTPDRKLRTNNSTPDRKKSSTPEGRLKSILKPSISGAHRGKMRSRSSHSSQSQS